MADGTKDKNGHEIISIIFRYLKNGQAIETLVAFERADDITARGISDLIINCINLFGIDGEKILSQCFDGAFVMSGAHGGVQTLIQQHYERIIPYVHCFNHRLHLVVIAVVSNVDSCRLFFDQVKLVHNFFNRYKVRKEYAGTNIPRLIEQRWSGHLKATQAISKNYSELLDALNKIKDGNGHNFEADDIVLASGISSAIMDKKFVFMLQFLNELLCLIEPANQILQKRQVGFRQAMPVIETVLESVLLLRTDESFARFLLSAEGIMEINGNEPRARRISHRSYRLTNSIVMSSLGEREMDADNPRHTSILKSQYFEIIDRVVHEIKRRFKENNDILLAIAEVNNIHSSSFNKNILLPLIEIGLTV